MLEPLRGQATEEAKGVDAVEVTDHVVEIKACVIHVDVSEWCALEGTDHLDETSVHCFRFERKC